MGHDIAYGVATNNRRARHIQAEDKALDFQYDVPALTAEVRHTCNLVGESKPKLTLFIAQSLALRMLLPVQSMAHFTT